MTPAFTPWTAPSFYQFTAAPTHVLRNLGEYLDRLAQHVGSGGLHEDLAYWREVSARESVHLPVDRGGSNTYGSTGVVSVRLGRHDTDAPRTIGIWKFSKNIDASKEWIKYLLGKKDVYDEYLMSGGGFNQPIYTKMQDHPVFKTDPKLAVLKGEGVQYHTYGWPAPASDRVQLITNSYILPNMMAKAVTGTSTKDAIGWAEIQVTLAQRAQVEALLRAGVNVICDDTNLRGRVVRTLLRGQTVWHAGRPVGEPSGRLVTPAP